MTIHEILEKAYNTACKHNVIVNRYVLLYAMIYSMPEYFEIKQGIYISPSDLLDILTSKIEKGYIPSNASFVDYELLNGINSLYDQDLDGLYDLVVIKSDPITKLLLDNGIVIYSGEQDPIAALGTDLYEEMIKRQPIIGRETELYKLIEVIAKSKKCNPILIGPAGVGKTAIVERLALKLHNGDVPDKLTGKKIYQLDLGVLTKPEIFSVFTHELMYRNDIIIFIDEIHKLNTDYKKLAQDLKPILSRNKVPIIGATTADEYKEIEKDKALERRFVKLYIGEPSREDTFRILENVRDYYSSLHNVNYSDKALWSIVDLTDKYMKSHSQPDKSIDVLDQAGAYYDISNSYGKYAHHKAHSDAMDSYYAYKMKMVASGALTDREKTKLLDSYRSNVKKYETSSSNAVKIKDAYKYYNKALSKYITLHEKGADYKSLLMTYLDIVDTELDLAEARDALPMVTEDDIKEVVSDITGIPVKDVAKNNLDKVINLNHLLSSKVVGQPEAVTALHNALKRYKAHIQMPGRPIGSFMFLGPTGVGKTYTAKRLAIELYGDENALVRFDMSEYMEKFNVSKLIGSPPGYVGYDEGGQLTEAIKRRPYSIILFDEIEKAHPEIYDLLLQILDDGRLTDSYGNNIDFQNTIIIMTSNIGSKHILKYHGADNKYDMMKEDVFKEMEQYFKPEFLNRIDEKVVFHSLDKASMNKIVRLQLNELVDRVSTNSNLSLGYDDKLVDYIIEASYNPVYGARTVSRTIKSKIETALADYILESSDLSKLYISSNGRAPIFKTA